MARVLLLVTVLTALGYMSQATPVPENVEKFENKIKELEKFKENDFLREYIEKVEQMIENKIQKVNTILERYLKETQEGVTQNLQYALTAGIENAVQEIADEKSRELMGTLMNQLLSILKREISKRILPDIKTIEELIKMIKTLAKMGERGGELLKKNLEKLSKILKKVEEKFNEISELVKEKCLEKIGKLQESMKQLINKVKGKLENVVGEAKEKLNKSLNNLKMEIKKLDKYFNDIVNGLGKAKDAINEIIKETCEKLKDELKNVSGKVLDKAQDEIKKITEHITEDIGKAKDAAGKGIKDLGKLVEGTANKIDDNLKNIGKSVNDKMGSIGEKIDKKGGLIGGVSDGVNKITKDVGGFVEETGDTLKNFGKGFLPKSKKD